MENDQLCRNCSNFPVSDKVIVGQYLEKLSLFNRHLNRDCLIYMFPLHFSGFFEATCHSSQP